MCKSYVSMCLIFFYHIVNIEVFTVEYIENVMCKSYVPMCLNNI